MGGGTQNSNPVSGCLDYASAFDPAHGGGRIPDPPRPGPLYKTNPNAREENNSNIPDNGGLETRSRGGPTGADHQLVHLTGVHPMAGTKTSPPPNRGEGTNL